VGHHVDLKPVRPEVPPALIREEVALVAAMEQGPGLGAQAIDQVLQIDAPGPRASGHGCCCHRRGEDAHRYRESNGVQILDTLRSLATYALLLDGIWAITGCLERLARAMEQPAILRDDWGFLASSMGRMRVDALMPLAKAAIKICDSIGLLEPYLPNDDGGWPQALDWAICWAFTTDRVAILDVTTSQAGIATSFLQPTIQILSVNERKRSIRRRHANDRFRKIHAGKSWYRGGGGKQSRL
jgi:hypothetical protein